jgi:integrase
VEELFTAIQRINAEIATQRAAGVAPMDVKIRGDERGQSREGGPTTQLRVFATLRAALNAAVRQRKITWNPCDGVELEHPDTAERQRWTPVEAARFIAFIADDEMGLMFRVAVLRAPRRAELCGFRWAGSDLEKPYPDPRTGKELTGALLGVERPIIQLGGKLVESKAKTKRGQRRIFLDHETAELVRQHRKAQLRLRLTAGEAWQDNDLVFCQEDGRPWNPDHVSKRPLVTGIRMRPRGGIGGTRLVAAAPACAAVGRGPHGRPSPQRGPATSGRRAVRVGLREIAEAAVRVDHVPVGVAHHARRLCGVHQVVRVALPVDLGQRLDPALLVGAPPGGPLVFVPVVRLADPPGLLRVPGPGAVPVPAADRAHRDAADCHVGAADHRAPVDRRNRSYLLAERYSQAAWRTAFDLIRPQGDPGILALAGAT